MGSRCDQTERFERESIQPSSSVLFICWGPICLSRFDSNHRSLVGQDPGVSFSRTVWGISRRVGHLDYEASKFERLA